MKALTLAGFVAAVSALPQYGNTPSPTTLHSHKSHHHHRGTVTTKVGGLCTAESATQSSAAAVVKDADKNFSTLSVDASSGVSYAYRLGTGSAVGTGTSAGTIQTKFLTSTQVVHRTVTKVRSEAKDAVQTSTHKSASKSHSKSKSKTASTHAVETTAAASSKDTNSSTKTNQKTASTSEEASTSTATAAVSSASHTLAASSSTSNAANGDFLRGINIGNWLILEKWMDETPFTGTFSAAADQYGFDSSAGAAAALQHHWSTWFTEADVQQIQSYGFNALRIPVGYWAFDNSGTPYQQGAALFLDEAIGWARKYNMKVLVDCHGSPGSQNGKVHSGHIGAIDWQKGDNMQKSTGILVTMAKKYGAANYSDVIWGIEMVNEPQAGSPNSFSKSQSWAQDTYTQMLAVTENKDLRIITHDSFMGPQKFVKIAETLTSNASALSSRSGSQKTTFGVDQHNYQLYTDENNAQTQEQHIKGACEWAADLATAKTTMPTIVGEWSALTNICAKSDGTTVPLSTGCGGDSSCSCTNTNPSKWSTALASQVRKYVEVQLEVYEQNSDGYFLWSWKGPGGWGVDGTAAVGAFPKNVVTDRKSQNVCGSP